MLEDLKIGLAIKSFSCLQTTTSFKLTFQSIYLSSTSTIFQFIYYIEYDYYAVYFYVAVKFVNCNPIICTFSFTFFNFFMALIAFCFYAISQELQLIMDIC